MAGRIRIISTLGLVFYAIPSFWLGLMLIVLFSVKLGWLPPGGFESIGAGLTGLDRVLDIATHLVLPVLSLALIFLAIYLRLMRASMLEVMNLDFVRTARAKGLSEGHVLWRHVLRNALLPMVTFVGLQFSTMLGGSVVIESVFSLPGLGRLAFESVVQRDLNTLLGIVLVSAVLVIVVNFLVDILYAQARPADRGEFMKAVRAYLRSPAGIIGAVLLVAVLAAALSADWFFPRDPMALAGRPLQWPGANPRLPLGTDNLGRDIAGFLFHGARVSLLIGLVASVVAVGIGVLVGAVAGFYGGWVDDLLMRITEAFQTVPNFILLLVLVAVFGSELDVITIAIGLVGWTAPCRLVRAEFLSLRSREFVLAARGLGMRDASADPGRGAAECAAAGHRLCQRDHGHRHPAGERAGLPRPVRPQHRLLGQHDRRRAGGAADRMVCLGHSRRRDPGDGAGLQPGRPGAERCAEPADAGAVTRAAAVAPRCLVRLPKGADREFALQGIDLEVAAGEILCVVGESGSGKSLTATAILGLLPAPRVTLAGGSITFEGEDLASLAARPAARRSAASGSA